MLIPEKELVEAARALVDFVKRASQIDATSEEIAVLPEVAALIFDRDSIIFGMARSVD